MWDSANSSSQQDNKCIRLTRYSVSCALIIVVVGYIGFPFVFRYSTYVKSNLTFLNFVKVPLHIDFHRPADYGLVGAKNFYLTTKDGATLGVWHTLPVELQQEAVGLDLNDPYNTTVLTRYNMWLSNATVFLYCHGSGGTRASAGRTRLYLLLNSLGYHVLTFDYRGYGDSTHRPKTESDVVTDAETVYTWLTRHVTEGHIFIWGHSLGTGVLSHMLAKLEQENNNRVTAAVLESSFNNLADALRAYPPSRPYSRLPGFNFFAVEPMNMHNLTFRSDEYLRNISSPLLFLHAEDDHVVPYRLGVKLYEAVVNSRKNLSNVNFISYEKELGLGHTKIYQDPNLSTIVPNFVKNSIERRTERRK